MRDKKHAEMMRAYVEWYRNTYKVEDTHDVEVEIEVPFNWYGERGFVDLLAKRTIPVYAPFVGRNPEIKIIGKDCFYDICELKTRIEDLGETIRQIRRAKEFFPLARGLLKSHCFGWLVLLDISDNRRCFKENEELLKAAGIETRFFDPSSSRVGSTWSPPIAPSRREGG